MAEMKTLNGYEVVDQTARDKISNLSTEVDTHKITLRDKDNNIIGNITEMEYDLIGAPYQSGKIINIPNPRDNAQLFERGRKVPKLVAILERFYEMEVNTSATIIGFDEETTFDGIQGEFIRDSDGWGYFKIRKFGAYKITVRVQWGEVNKNTRHKTGIAINNMAYEDVQYCSYSFTDYIDISEFTTILRLYQDDTVKIQLQSTMKQKAKAVVMYIERIA